MNTLHEAVLGVSTSTPIISLLDLPTLVVGNVLEHLGVPTLLTLRTVCKTTKYWVENPAHFKKISLSIKNYAQLEQLMNLNTTTLWSTIVVQESLCNDSSLTPFLDNLKFSLTSLTIRHSKHMDALELSGLKLILLNFKSLESLEFYCGIGNTKAESIENVEEWKMFFEQNDAIIKENLKGLKKLAFKIFNSCRFTVHYILVAFLSVCPNLSEIVIPDMPMHPDITEAELTQPLINYLKRRSANDVRWRHQNSLSLYFGSIKLGSYELMGNKFAFPITTELLLELVETTQFKEPSGFDLKLYNVPSQVLPGIGQLVEPILEKRLLDDCIASVHCSELPTGIPLESVHVPPGAKLDLVLEIELGSIPELNIPPTANIRSIILQCEEKSIFEVGSTFGLFLQGPRPTVQHIVLHIVETNLQAQKCIKFSTIFPNLKTIWLSNFKSLDCLGEDSVLGGLTELEELELDTCELIGGLEFTQLKKIFKKMRRFEMEYCTYKIIFL